MTLRKITIDNSVKDIPISEQTKERDLRSNTLTKNSLPGKQNENISQNNKKKFLKNTAAGGCGILEWIMNSYV